MAEFFKNVLVPGITVVTALLAAWVNYSVSTVKSMLIRLTHQAPTCSILEHGEDVPQDAGRLPANVPGRAGVLGVSGGASMASRLRMSVLRSSPGPTAPGDTAKSAPLSRVPGGDLSHCGDDPARDADASPCLVLGRLPGDLADAGNVGSPASAAIGHRAVRDGLPVGPQASRFYGAARPRPDWSRVAG